MNSLSRASILSEALDRAIDLQLVFGNDRNERYRRVQPLANNDYTLMSQELKSNKNKIDNVQ
jgi:hypothetical protein